MENSNNSNSRNLLRNYYSLKEEEKKSQANDSFSISSLSISQKVSRKYKAKVQEKFEEKNNNADYLFNKRENKLVDILENREKKKEKNQQTGKILNDFLYQMQNLLGVKNPQNLLENGLDKVDHQDLINKLQKMYKIVNHKANVE